MSFFTDLGEVRAVDGVSFSMRRGSVLALVGESGCGKSVTSYALLRLIQKPGRITRGSIRAHRRGQGTTDIASLSEHDDTLYSLRGGWASMIFQEPMTALSPVHTIGSQIIESILLHQHVTKSQARSMAGDMLARVGIPGAHDRLDQYPHELSGGMRQRVVIAMALVCKPELLIANEPTTALDVTIQAQILTLLKGLQQDLGMGILMITHDIGVVAQIADEVAVMYLGKIVERGDVRTILKTPRHPYTIGLLRSLPSMNAGITRLPSIPGSVPGSSHLPAGCSFHPRCAYAVAGECDRGQPPDLVKVTNGHHAACLRAAEIDSAAQRSSSIPQPGDLQRHPHITLMNPPDDAPSASTPNAAQTDATHQHSEPILSVRRLSKHYPVLSKSLIRKRIGTVRACDNISFDLMPGETLGLVGESGCGKTTLGRAILRAIKPTSGEVLYRDETSNHYHDLASLREAELKPLRTQLQMIFQDPFSSLNPRMTIQQIVSEPLRIHRLASGSELHDRVAAILTRVGIRPEYRNRYPHAFSGGQRQRIGIARALIVRPRLIIADESVSALDVSVQAQVINLLADLQDEYRLTYIFIAHDLSVVKHICHRVAVMYAGRIVEIADKNTLFENPSHPYTRALLNAVPCPDPDITIEHQLSGEVADVANLPTGCAFNPRCREVMPACREQRPELQAISDRTQAACHLHNHAQTVAIRTPSDRS
ncbi:ABC transporter ATP-binding protein [Mucisphaera calidilacus]|uniref:Oligopeptide transport ATP-binding protein OppF n=1 Tax=Mucisphaera calidilacus TaxID=2527982 RepID=A0A518BX40_9BACT|nr:ABC transporter ATP-binding protein [Mucisphaera calidilacus]QDU71535.1 Oligopeptide transport ATP-binding protein OppF [Mucisphaera calidilacus]